jgi:class 3 adenylate cyclase
MPDLPSGTVTFLFTDIAGSTALWERDRQVMAQAVDRHLHLLRIAIDAHEGVLVKTVGDAVQAAFPSAPVAVAAALKGPSPTCRWAPRASLSPATEVS